MRASGALCTELAHKHFKTKKTLAVHTAAYGRIVDEHGTLIDRGLAILARAPHSYTGEDTLEFHVHGSPVLAAEVLRALLASGARYAEAGEFTRRAFLNGKLDLHAAASVADLIDAEHRSAARAALANMGGALANEVRDLRARLAGILEEVAASIDYPDEVPEPDRVLAITGRIDLVHANNSRDAFDSGADRHANFDAGTIDAEQIAAVAAKAGCDVLVETPAEGQADDIAYLRQHLPSTTAAATSA